MGDMNETIAIYIYIYIYIYTFKLDYKAPSLNMREVCFRDEPGPTSADDEDELASTGLDVGPVGP